jgi:hypothetical protein
MPCKGRLIVVSLGKMFWVGMMEMAAVQALSLSRRLPFAHAGLRRPEKAL